MSKIDQLDETEQRRLAEARNEWGWMHFKPMPADRQQAEAACDRAYRQLGRPIPSLKIWFRSPLAARIGSHVIERYLRPSLYGIPQEPPRMLRDRCRTRIGTEVLEQVWTELQSEDCLGKWREVGRSLHGMVFDRLLTPAYEEAVERLHPRLIGTLCGEGADLLRWCEPRDELYRFASPDALAPDPLGHLDRLSNWIAVACHRTFPSDWFDLSQLAALVELWESCGGWCPYRGAVCFVERPSLVHLDQERRLHCAEGMALAYPDGCGLYVWHGVTVQKEVILSPDRLMPQDILNERNVEVRRIMIDRYGLDRLLTSTRSQCLDVDQDGRRALYRLRLSHDEPIVAVKVRCPSTGQVYFLRVPPAIRTCRDAVAWTFGFENGGEYQPIVQT